MSQDAKWLRDRVARALSATTFDQAQSRIKAIVGPQRTGLARQAIDKLEREEVPSAQELFALEMLIRTMRPALLSRDRELEDLPSDNGAFPQWGKFRSLVRPHLYCIGRIDAVGPGLAANPDPPDDPVGTGFLVSATVLVTNAHVLNVLSGGTFTLQPGQAVVRFKREYGAVPDEPAVGIDDVIVVDRQHDIALLRVKANPAARDGRRHLELDVNSPLARGAAVAVIGYPTNDVSRNPMFVSTLFGDRFNVKRASPGEITGDRAGTISHDCSTLGGNSGSPVISLESAKVLGVHRAGTFLTSNDATGAFQIATCMSQVDVGGH